MQKPILLSLPVIYAALAFTAPLLAQTSSVRPGSSSRSTGTSSGSRPGGGTSTSSGRSAGQYPSNTQLGDAVITIDSDTRSLVIVTDEDTNKELGKVIKNLDKPKPQVLIKVAFVEVTYDKSLNVGLEGSYTFNLKSPVAANTGSTVTTNTTNTPITNGTSNVVSTLTVPQNTTAKVGTAAQLQNLYGLSSLTQGSFLRLTSDNWSATLHALANNGKVEVLSRPSIMARNNQEAVIVVGSEVPFITSSSLTSTGQTNNTIQYDNIGIILRVTPFITNEGTVEMIVSPEISALTDQTVPIGNNTSAPVISKRSAETVVVTPDAQTVVIGGMMQSQKTSSIDKIPILGDIPLLGAAFRHTVTNNTKTELLIFLTPYIVNTGKGLEGTTADEVGRTELLHKAYSQKELDKYLDNLPVAAPTPAPAPKKDRKKSAPPTSLDIPTPMPDASPVSSSPSARPSLH